MPPYRTTVKYLVRVNLESEAPPMPTTPERLATLEARMDDAEQRTAELASEIHGGPGVDFSHSLRGRIHHMQSAMASADKLREAAQAVERAQREQSHSLEVSHRHTVARWLQIVLAICAVVTAAAAVIGAASALFG